MHIKKKACNSRHQYLQFFLMDGKFEVQPNLCLVLFIVLNSMIVIDVSLVANVCIHPGILANLKKKKWEHLFPQMPCALNSQLIRKKNKLGKFSSHLSSFGLVILGYKSRNLGQRVWDKVRSYWEHVGGTHWKLGEHVDGNTMATKLGTTKTQHPCPPPQKKMHFGPLGWMLPHLIGCKIFLGFYLCSLPFLP